MDNIGWIEIHVVDHCNNNCRWCHNYSPFSERREFSPEEYYDGLDVLKLYNVRYDNISLMGGEPFLHENLHDFAYKILERYRKPLMLTTNGFWLSEHAVKAHADLWRIVSWLKISRYPTVEKRLGGIAEMRRIASLIKQFNPGIIIEIPDKSIFNKLEFTALPRDVETYCGNSQCTALLPDMTMGRCGAGAYLHLAPDGAVPDGFRESRHMMYDLRNYEAHTFLLWRRRYPLDACSFCSFSGRQLQTRWKVERGRPVFNTEYEREYDFVIGKRLVVMGEAEDARRMARNMRERYGERVETEMLECLLAARSGQRESAVKHITRALELAPDNAEAMGYLRSIRTALTGA